MKKTLLLAVISVLSFLTISPLVAQKATYNIKKSTANISIDGHLDESDWQSAEVMTDFIQFEPVEGARPSQKTEVRIVYGESAIYFGMMMYDSAPDSIVQTLGRRDDFNRADRIWIGLDSYHDLKTAYVFAVSAAGVQFDGVSSGDNRQSFDDSWNAVWHSETRLTSEGWIAEVRIPYSMLRFPKASSQVWGLDITREIARNSEYNDWVMVPHEESGWVSHYGEIHGLNGISPRRNIQVAPYILGSATTNEAKPRLTDNLNQEIGGDLKIGITSNITLDATFNPDFGQVEADPAQLNLSTFETFFQERRPFFVEGAQIFDFNFVGRDGKMLYTRRIGSTSSPIIGATKVSGRTDGGLSFGFLGALTGDNYKADKSFGALRMKQDFGANSYVGGMFTAANRSITDFRRTALVAGLDMDHRMSANTYRLKTFFTASNIQEPDDDATTNGAAGAVIFEKIRGFWGGSLGLRFISEDYNANDLGQQRESNIYRIHMAYNRQFNEGKEFSIFRRASVFAFTWSTWQFSSKEYQGISLFSVSNFQLKSFKSINIEMFAQGLGGYNFRETRRAGNFVDTEEPAYAVTNENKADIAVTLNSDSREALRLRIGASGGVVGAGTNFGFGGGINWDVNERFSFSTDINYRISNRNRAWFANESFRIVNDTIKIWDGSLVDFAGAEGLVDILPNYNTENTEGDYEVPFFGDRDTRQLNISFRGNLTFTPDLSLQVYNQVFFAKGQYDNFRALIKADKFASFDAYPKSPNFALHSYNSNIVLRWEYLPGSTVFVVWSQNRASNFFNSNLAPVDYNPYSASPADQFAETFEAYPTNVFLIKLNYLFLR